MSLLGGDSDTINSPPLEIHFYAKKDNTVLIDKSLVDMPNFFSSCFDSPTAVGTLFSFTIPDPYSILLHETENNVSLLWTC
jgi:hypothetical protein